LHGRLFWNRYWEATTVAATTTRTHARTKMMTKQAQTRNPPSPSPMRMDGTRCRLGAAASSYRAQKKGRRTNIAAHHAAECSLFSPRKQSFF
jgi:hypothetical protein